jgi:hypothetical protein
MKTTLALFFAAGFTVPSATVAAQVSALDATVRREVVDSVTAQVERWYVDPDTGRLIAAHIRTRAQRGVYDSATVPRRLAELLTTDLRAINGDLHLSVSFAPPSASGAPRSLLSFADRSQHYALGRIDVLPGNVGYMELTGFSGDPGARDMIVSALKYLESTDAIIFDVRRNRGGSAGLVNFLVSHFTGNDTVASLVVKSRGAERGNTRYTLANVPGPRRPDVPLYVLTSRSSGSAGEDFPFVLKNMKRATIVGDRTAGAGHNVRSVPSGHGFQTGISITRVSDPRTGLEWEQVGVQPDVKVDPAIALETAHRMALDTLLAKASNEARRTLELHREVAAAREAPRVVSPDKLAVYAGDYDGGRNVSIRGGTLYYRTTATAMPEPAVALSDSTFALSSLVRLNFERVGNGSMRIRAALPDGGTTIIGRVSTPR